MRFLPGLVDFEFTKIVIELISWVAGSAVAVGGIIGGALRVDLGAGEGLRLIVVPTVAFEAA